VAADVAPAAPVRDAPARETFERQAPAFNAPRYSAAALQEAEREFQHARALFEQKQFAEAAAAFHQVVNTLDRGDSIFGLRSIAAEFADASRALASRADADSPRVYTSVDEGVTEPVALSRLPPQAGPGAPASHVALLELLIDARGHVESAHLIGADQHFRDRWLASAAKSWLFQPAARDGRPVRFLKRLSFVSGEASGPRSPSQD
jgi:hypothetical protein